MLWHSPALAGLLTLNLSSQEFIEYRLQLDAGSYTFGAMSDDGDPDIAIRHLNANEHLAVSADTGDEELPVTLSAGAYILRLQMHSCSNVFALFGLGTCEAALYVEKANDENFVTEVFVYDRGMAGASSGGGGSNEECEYHEHRTGAGACVPNPVYRY